MSAPPLILASASAARRRLLTAAGVPHTVVPALVDEAAARESCRHEGLDAEGAATVLADLKARAVSRLHPGALVLGADQILDCDGVWYEKPADVAAARAQLLALRGRSHTLATVAVMMRDGERLWQQGARPRLTMRAFSHAFLDQYLATAGAALTACVGAYALEEQGIQLFAHVAGDAFAIQGLPLWSLLDYLRTLGVIPE